MLARSQVFKEDLVNMTDLYAFQRNYKLTPLSSWRVGGEPLDVLAVKPESDPNAPSANEFAESLTGCEYFNLAAELWGYNRNIKITKEMRKHLLSLGIRPGKPVLCIGPLGEALEFPIYFWKGELAALGIKNLCKAGAGPGCSRETGPYDWNGLKSIGNYGVDYQTRA